MLPQAKKTKDLLEKVGLKWPQDFTVRTQRFFDGKKFIGHGDTNITIWNSEKALEVTPELLQHFAVEHRIRGAMTYVLVSDYPYHKGRFIKREDNASK